MNKLVEIPLQDLPKLRYLYAKRTDHASYYNLIQICINWLKKEPTFPLKIYSLNGEWKVDGTFVAEFGGFYNQIFCNTCSDNLTRLEEAINCYYPSKYHLLTAVQECILPVIEQHFIDSGLKREAFQPTETVMYYIPKEEALKFNIKTTDGVSLKPLKLCHAEFINNMWPYRYTGSDKFVKMLIRLNDSVGVFENNALVAWCLILPLGSLGLLQVVDSHKRKGYGSLAVRSISRLLAKKGFEVTAPVVFANAVSRSMFEKLGFKIVDKVYWTNKPAAI